MTSAMTPTVTPSVEIIEMTEMKACFRLASRYLEGDVKLKGDVHDCTSARMTLMPRFGFMPRLGMAARSAVSMHRYSSFSSAETV